MVHFDAPSPPKCGTLIRLWHYRDAGVIPE